ncbi:MAG: hypothetical protein FWF54_07355 [Candidatus Azobacteroides sp.]|nr:hypothetical protein [Candidatus Azobacteroides sp.]
MSENKQLIEIKPPKSPYIKGKVHTIRGIPCAYCNGNGYFTSEQTIHNEHEKNPCPVCKGAGKMQAKVVVGWLPDNV